MEGILSRKVLAIKMTGLPYTRQIVQILAIHIFHKLISYNLYNTQGQRINRGLEIDEEIIHAVEHAQLASQYLCKSSKKTEYHKSTLVSKNVTTATYVCKMCQRRFKCQVNLTLHIYWHTIKDHFRDDGDPDDPMDNSESEDEGLTLTTATPHYGHALFTCKSNVRLNRATDVQLNRAMLLLFAVLPLLLLLLLPSLQSSDGFNSFIFYCSI